MAKKSRVMTKTQLIRHLAEINAMTRKNVIGLMDSLVKTAYKNASQGFTIPGLGKLELVNRKARIGRNPGTGELIKIPAKKIVKFRIAKHAKSIITGTDDTGPRVRNIPATKMAEGTTGIGPYQKKRKK